MITVPARTYPLSIAGRDFPAHDPEPCVTLANPDELTDSVCQAGSAEADRAVGGIEMSLAGSKPDGPDCLFTTN